MKACIVTVYNTLNCGSFLQAYALGKYLESLGIEVYYYKINNSSSSSLKYLIHKIKNFNNKKEKQLITERYNEYKKMQKKLKVINNIRDMDLIVLGSDTIWNLKDKFFYKKRKIFFGAIFDRNKTFSYAASFANSNIENIRKDSNIKNALLNLRTIGVRDFNSFNIVKKISNRDSSLVCDPTLLLEMDDYKNLIKEQKRKKYIFLYLFNDLSPKQSDEVKSFSKKYDLEIISGNNVTNIGKYSNSYPSNFLTDIFYSNLVITDTFHGVLFSIIFNKNFIVIDRQKTKVNEFLQIIKLDDRIVDNDDSFKHLINNNSIDYSICSDEINKLKNNSKDFINISIKEICENENKRTN